MNACLAVPNKEGSECLSPSNPKVEISQSQESAHPLARQNHQQVHECAGVLVQLYVGDLICLLLQLSSMQYLQQTHRECLFPASTPQCSIRRRHVLVRAAQAADTVKVFYRTNWGSAKLHGSLQGAAWKDFDLKKVRHPQCTSMTHAVHPLQPTQALQRLATSHMPIYLLRTGHICPWKVVVH